MIAIDFYLNMVSIPAPTRGATNVLPILRHNLFGFYSRPYSRGDTRKHLKPAHITLFLFPPLLEGRRYVNKKKSNGKVVSIPAPTRGATQVSVLHLNRLCGFYSRPYSRGDLNFSSNRLLTPVSIPAPTRGATAANSKAKKELFLFLFPPLLEGRHGISPTLSYSVFVSIPAPTRGATEGRNQLLPAYSFLFPPLLEGRLDISILPLPKINVSIPAPTRGATPATYRKCRMWLFLFPPLLEGRPWRVQN